MDSERREADERPNQVTVTGPQYVDNVLTHQIPVLGSESLKHGNQTRYMQNVPSILYGKHV